MGLRICLQIQVQPSEIERERKRGDRCRNWERWKKRTHRLPMNWGEKRLRWRASTAMRGKRDLRRWWLIRSMWNVVWLMMYLGLHFSISQTLYLEEYLYALLAWVLLWSARRCGVVLEIKDGNGKRLINKMACIWGGMAVWWGLFRVWFPLHFIYSEKIFFFFNLRRKRKRNGMEERDKDSTYLWIRLPEKPLFPHTTLLT